jgi:hypothetical protein
MKIRTLLIVLLVVISIGWAKNQSIDVKSLPSVGVGLNGLSYWTTSCPLAEVSRIGNDWISFKPGGSWSDNRPIKVGPEGYPISLQPQQSVRTLVFTHTEHPYPAGDYVLTWKGSGQIELEGCPSTIIEQRPYRRVYRYDKPIDGVGILITIHKTDPKDTIRDINLWMPGLENAKTIWHPILLENIRPFGVIRFMDMGSTNNNPLADWQNRCKPGDAHYGTDRGIPYELMIDLGNTAKKDIWICVPHKATDDFVRQLAMLVKSSLHPPMRVWVEYSNEVWNWMFQQAGYNEQRAKEASIPYPQMYGRRTGEIVTIFKDVFGEQSGRVIGVCSGQHFNPWILEQAMKEAAGKVDVVSVAAYFTAPNISEWVRDNPKASMDEIFSELKKGYAKENLPKWKDNMEIARRYNLPMVAYEGGPHFTANGADNKEWIDRMAEANRSPQMVEMYQRVLSDWKNDVGAATFVAFVECGSWGRHGYWGLKEYADQPLEQATKYRAVTDWIKRQK